jgi:hypothetical protein
MVTFDQFVRRFGGLKKHIVKSTQRMLKEAGIVQMIVDQQHEGVGSDGSKMQSGYSTGYSKRRKKKGLQTSFVDLHFTGKMHKGMKVIPVKDGVDIRSKEPYEYYVRANFPKGFSLTQEHANTVGNIVANHLAVEMKKFLVA